MIFLHFIGRGYYSVDSFSKEAEKYGVQRRIRPCQAKKMRTGDVVLCAMAGKEEGALVFGMFVVNGLAGASQQTIEELKERGQIVEVEDNLVGQVIKRGCGSYILSGHYQASCSIREIAEVMEKNGDTMFVTGDYYAFTYPLILKDYKFARGAFIPLDREALWRTMKSLSTEEQRKKKQLLVIPGNFTIELKERKDEEEKDEINQVLTLAGYDKAKPRHVKKYAGATML